MPGAGALPARPTLEDKVLTKTTSAAAGTAPVATAASAPTSEQVLARIIDSVEDDKAEEVVTIDLRGRTSIADYMVICSGRSSRQVGAIAQKLLDRLKEDFGLICKIEGKEQGDWVLIDAHDVIVHVFRPEVREFYQLEKMWMPSAAAGAVGPGHA
jgi:ribosome-associated protein